ncbi:UvrD-helicase domain-containing protein [Rubrivivax gelatinosus]|uniref:UvrD-helicase domain-containing protein n=2 Tax=Rubrivivax gelatinosus TaxID=28068 RepID=UPI0018CAD649|nr:UvrD-helicase domain-containing protein [Rubrivivax gelatinosus]
MTTPLHLTGEQRRIVSSKADVLAVKARAGTGKSFTLRAVARSFPDLRILYLAFNKPIQEAAQQSFPSNVTCLTTHALAYPRFGRKYRDAGKLGFVNPADVMDFLGLDTPARARQVLSTVESFLRSDAREIAEAHVPTAVLQPHRSETVQFARQVWASMKDVGGTLKITHDGYFKLFHLSKPDLSLQYDLVLFDEAQDANEVLLDLILEQKCRLILVGDEHQSIYGFRGALNALEQVEADEELLLTNSFRYGAGIARLATMLLAGLKGDTVPVIGRGEFETVWTVDRDKPYAVISRTNASVFSEAVSLLGRVKFHIIGLEKDAEGRSFYAPFEKLVDVHSILAGSHHLVRDPVLKRYKTQARLEEYAGSTDDKELLMLLKIARDYGAKVPALVAQIKAEVVTDARKAHVTLSTAHRSKGLEFMQVILSSDFEEFVAEDGRIRPADTDELVQEANLLYVAATRSLHALETNRQIKEIEVALQRAGFKLPLPSAEQLKSAETVQAAAEVAYAAIARAQVAAPAAQPLAANPRVQLAGEIPAKRMHDFFKRSIKDQVQHAILVEGLLDVGEMALYLNRNRDDMIALLGGLIASGHLHARLFSHEPAVATAAVKASRGEKVEVSDAFL